MKTDLSQIMKILLEVLNIFNIQTLWISKRTKRYKMNNPKIGRFADSNSSLKMLLQFIIFTFFVSITSVYGQQTTGNVRGIVKDPNGAVVSGAQVTITNPQTKISRTVLTGNDGDYQFSNLEPGDYTINIVATNFKNLTLSSVRIQLNQTTDLPAELQIGGQSEVVNISAAGAELVETSTTTLSQTFQGRQVSELAQTSVGSGVNNLALIAPGVSSSGGVGVGTGGSVGGQRPRNNNFVLDGVDNNDKSVTGPQVYVSPEVVNQFTLLQNQFSAEFVRSNGGQFITVTKSGTNDFHGSTYGFFRNRYLNALDTQQKDAGVTGDTKSRADYQRFGFNVGGPLLIPRFGENSGSPVFLARDKAFFFFAYERLQTGNAAGAAPLTAPTAAGFALLNSTPGLSANNLAIFNRFTPVAANNDAGFTTVGGRQIPLGNVQVESPSFSAQNYFVVSIDVTQSEKTQHKGRFSLVNLNSIDTAASLPAFFTTLPSKQRLFAYTLLHNFTPKFINETRLSYRRTNQFFNVPDITFPGLDAFPNLTFDDLSFNLGPDPNAPQGNIENNYQVVNQSTVILGNHAVKFGGDYRRIISPQVFVQRGRGDYEYSTLERFLQDLNPDALGERNVGSAPYAGDQHIFFAFLQDDYRIRPNVTLNLGVNYSYQGVPRGAQEQSRNAISSVPGLLEFNAPKAQKKNFAPKVGIVYAPNFDSGLLGRAFGSNGKSSIRAGFSLGYDYIFDNLYILSNPPQAQQTIDIDLAANTPNFLANGGIRNVVVPTNTNVAAARAATGSFIPDQEVPYSITYSLSVQRQFAKNYAVEFRYLGTRGVHLLTQNRINRQAKVSPTLGGLPTYLARPTQAQLDALPLTLAQIQARSSFLPEYAAAGFASNSTQNVVGFLSNGNSSYQGGSVQLTRRFSDGFSGSAAYTLSHLIDDSTAEVFSTVLSPRRAEDFQNIRAERADSALDRRHRFVTAINYELPFFKKDGNKIAHALLGGFSFAGTYTIESGEKATVRSGIDSNLNGDSAGDRSILNVNGIRNTGSTVTALPNTAGQIVAYLADNPNAQYILAGPGAVTTAGRNTLQLPKTNNLDFSVFKNFRFGEVKRIQLRADFFNAFNHAQYIPGSPNDVTPISTATIGGINQLSTANLQPGGVFNNPSRIFSSNPRVIQLALRFDF